MDTNNVNIENRQCHLVTMQYLFYFVRDKEPVQVTGSEIVAKWSRNGGKFSQ